MVITSTYQHIRHGDHIYRRVSAPGQPTYWEVWEWPQNDTVGKWHAVIDDNRLEVIYRENNHVD